MFGGLASSSLCAQRVPTPHLWHRDLPTVHRPARGSLKCPHVPLWAGDSISLTCMLALHIFTPLLTQTHPSAPPTHTSPNGDEPSPCHHVPSAPLPLSPKSPSFSSEHLPLPGTQQSLHGQPAGSAAERWRILLPTRITAEWESTRGIHTAGHWDGEGWSSRGTEQPSDPRGAGGPGCLPPGTNPQWGNATATAPHRHSSSPTAPQEARCDKQGLRPLQRQGISPGWGDRESGARALRPA